MSESNKYLVKPTVRFSQSSDTERETSKEQMKRGKPEIRSIEIVKKPVRIVKKPENVNFPAALKENEESWKQWNSPILAFSDENNKNEYKKICVTDVEEVNHGASKPTESLSNVSPRDKVDVLPLSKMSNVKLVREDDNVTLYSKQKVVDKSYKGKENEGSILNKKISKTVNVMPCHKYKATIPKKMPKAKMSPVRKTVVRNIHGQRVKPYVGPGVSRDKCNLEMPKSKDENLLTGPNITSAEKLAHPEYNTIMRTINKLNEAKNEKIVTDTEHLPLPYKNFINRKVSNALDFPMGEAIYKNLVDLTVDEKQLPSRLMRTKDPEPRQKDIVPSLSDFFTPLMIEEEYCVAASPKSRVVETADNNWNAFTISDKVLEWKHNMDKE